MDAITDQLIPPSGGAPTREFSTESLASGEDFFKLVTAQLRGQDPLEPVEESQFMGQLAQFAQLDESASTNEQLKNLALLQENLAALQQMTQGVGLIGQSVEFTDPSSGEGRSGVVDAVRVENGVVVLDVAGERVPLPFLSAITTTEE